jgi:hypothetical protein
MRHILGGQFRVVQLKCSQSGECWRPERTTMESREGLTTRERTTVEPYKVNADAHSRPVSGPDRPLGLLFSVLRFSDPANQKLGVPKKGGSFVHNAS